MSIRLLVCDDHPAIRAAVAGLLTGTEIEIVGEAATGRETLQQAGRLKPDVILLDIRMPDGDGFSTLARLRWEVPECRVVMFSKLDYPTYIARAMALGASGYVPKGSPRETIIGAIVDAARIRPPIQDDFVPAAHCEPRALQHVSLP
jgi:DNA-binding NarL/FixJ family response regulator